MRWQLVAGVLQLVLIAAWWWSGGARRGADRVVVAVVLGLLAAGTLAGLRPVIVVAAVFYTVWAADQALSWVPVGHSRPAPRALVSAASAGVLVAIWLAVAVAATTV